MTLLIICSTFLLILLMFLVYFNATETREHEALMAKGGFELKPAFPEDFNCYKMVWRRAC